MAARAMQDGKQSGAFGRTDGHASGSGASMHAVGGRGPESAQVDARIDMR